MTDDKDELFCANCGQDLLEDEAVEGDLCVECRKVLEPYLNPSPPEPEGS